MSKININVWQVIVKVIIAVATTILGAIGIGNGDDKATRLRATTRDNRCPPNEHYIV